MKIEVLFPEVANLYGELMNVKYMERSSGGIELVNTGLNERPAFLSGGIDLVYMGTMSESSQLLAAEKLMKYSDDIAASVESGQAMLMTGNAHEIFGREIRDLDDMPYGAHPLVDTEAKTTRCLGIFDTAAGRRMTHRFNSLYLGKYGEIDVAGFKSTFSYTVTETDTNLKGLFSTVRGPGLDLSEGSDEGISYKNYRATYLIGPLMALNPPLMVRWLEELGLEGIVPAEEDAAMDACRARIAEYSDPGRGFIYD